MRRTFTAWMFLFATCITPVFTAPAQGTAFTYQGRLNDGGSPASGTYDFRFRLASDPLANNYIGSPYLTNGIAVTGGLFAARPDFGPGIFTGSNYWLEVDVRTNGAGIYTALTPLQPLTPTPYAVFANSSSNLLGVLPAGQLSGSIPNGNLPASASFSGTVTANTFTGNGVNVSNVNALTLNGLSSSNFWQLGGNNVSAGQFLGSTNNQPVEIWANRTRALRLEPGASGAAAPNVIGGSPVNFVVNGMIGSTIGGGGTTNYFGFASTNSVTGNFGTVGGGWGNTAAGYSTVSGGYQNVATGSQATVAGGNGNIASQDNAAVGGGYLNRATNYGAFVGGGENNVAAGTLSVVAGGGGLSGNQATGPNSAVGGGEANLATNAYATIPGGFLNIAGGQYSFAAGQQALATNDGAFVWADTQNGVFGSTTTNQFNVRANGGVRFVTSGAGITVDGSPVLTSAAGNGIVIQTNLAGAPNTISGAAGNFVASGVVGATISGGGATNYYYYYGTPFLYTNSVTGDFGTVGGGAINTASDYSFVGGGFTNTASGNAATIGGGDGNVASGYYEPTVAGGYYNTASGYYYATVGGGAGNTASGQWSTVAGGGGNTAGGSGVYDPTVGGGNGNTASGNYSTVAGGLGNTASGDGAFIGGGGSDNFHPPAANQALGKVSVVAGGLGNYVDTNGYGATIGGGDVNTNGGNIGTIAGGQKNLIFQPGAGPVYQPSIGGGYGNVASNAYATIPGGILNVAGGAYSFAAGQQAQALHQGAFVWADSQGSSFASTANDQFNVRAQGGVRFVTSGAGLTVDGFPLLASGGGSGITIQYNTNGGPNIVAGSPYNYVAANIMGATIAGGGATNFNGLSYTNSVLGYFGTVSGGAQNIAANYSVVAGGLGNLNVGNYSAIGGGWLNTNDSDYTVISGGVGNWVHYAGASYVGGGNDNFILAPINNYYFDVIAGGALNTESNVSYSFIGGGIGNTDYTSFSVIAGGATNLLNTFARFSVIGGGQANIISSNADHAVIGGGFYNLIGTNSVMSVIAGGASNFISASTPNGTIGGGSNNIVNGISGTVAGGEENSASAFRDSVGGGVGNTASGGISTVAGGWANVASGNSSSVAGGDHNVASGLGAVVAGGENNIASGAHGFAAGQQAQALHQGAFVWADSQNGAFASTTNDEFSIRASNGVHIATDKGIHLNNADRPIIVRDWDVFATNAPSYKAGIGRWGLFMESGILTMGIPDNVGSRFFQVAKYATNGTFTTLVLVDQAGDLYATNNVFAKGVQLTSDRNAKEHFTPLNPQSVLAKVAALPITEWNYKSDNADDKHIGPVAQDFHQAFGLNGTDDRHISAVDESGVALSAIQGLNQEMEELKTENAELKQRLATLEKFIENRTMK